MNFSSQKSAEENHTRTLVQSFQKLNFFHHYFLDHFFHYFLDHFFHQSIRGNRSIAPSRCPGINFPAVVRNDGLLVC
ncbi:hypothetical protein AM228_10360 [Planktothricoides sp. SR001]|nr:hypothetical protein AM228_10360 [Planktothricoides sp. SR001]